MKYTVELIIEAPIEKFIEKMDDPDNMKHWQRGFSHYEMISDVSGETGSQMKMYYSKPKMELVETIIKRDMPREFHASYDAKGMILINRNYFSSTEDGHTKWISENEGKTDNFIYKIMAFLLPGMFKKNTVKMMNDLKAFVETGTSVEGK